MTSWVYPWDLARLGTAPVLSELAEQGFQGINLAATYHPISIISPRGPHLSGFFAPSGGVFFPARSERYGRIKPAVWADTAVIDAWAEAAARLDQTGLELNAWTIGLYQPWMAHQYPDVARTYATGDRVDAGVCASSADVREYLRSLVADLTDQVPLGVVKLEGVHNPRYDYGWIRPRVYFELTPQQKHFLSICFCRSCADLGRDRGLDVAALQARVLDQLRPPAPEGKTVAGGEAGPADEELEAYLRIAPESAARLVRELAAQVRSTSPGTTLAVASPNEAGGAGIPIEELIDHVGTVLLLNLGEQRAEIERTAAVVRATEGRATEGRVEMEYMLHPPFTSVGPLPSNVNQDLDEPGWLQDLDDVLELGVTRLSLYNYGLLTSATFAALVSVARRAVARRPVSSP